MREKKDDQTLVRDALDTTRKAIAEGEAILQKARDDYRLEDPDDADGPKMLAFKQGGHKIERSLTSPLTDTMRQIITSITASERVEQGADDRPAPTDGEIERFQALNKRQFEYPRNPLSEEEQQEFDALRRLLRNSQRTGRKVLAAVGLAKLRELYEAIDVRDLPDDERTWEAFAAKHVPLPPEIVAKQIGRMVHAGGLIECCKCGTKSKAECGCGAPYKGTHRWAMPIEQFRVEFPEAEPKGETALDRAVAAITADPEKSDRAIAEEIGVGKETVRRARQQMKDGAVDGAVERVGLDGRRRRLPGRRSARPLPPQDPERDLIQDEMHPDAVTEEERWQWSAANLYGDLVAADAYWRREFGDWRQFKPPKELVELMKQAENALKSHATKKPEGRKTNGKA